MISIDDGYSVWTYQLFMGQFGWSYLWCYVDTVVRLWFDFLGLYFGFGNYVVGGPFGRTGVDFLWYYWSAVVYQYSKYVLITWDYKTVLMILECIWNTGYNSIYILIL